MNFVFFVAAIAGAAMAAFASDDAPIGVFDSGLGGLTVLERLLDVDQVDNATGRYGPDGVPDLAHERFTYLGDQANMPYGDYAAEGKSDYLRKRFGDDVFRNIGRLLPRTGALIGGFDD